VTESSSLANDQKMAILKFSLIAPVIQGTLIEPSGKSTLAAEILQKNIYDTHPYLGVLAEFQYHPELSRASNRPA
jgi:hypothetical protein